MLDDSLFHQEQPSDQYISLTLLAVAIRIRGNLADQALLEQWCAAQLELTQACTAFFDLRTTLMHAVTERPPEDLISHQWAAECMGANEARNHILVCLRRANDLTSQLSAIPLTRLGLDGLLEQINRQQDAGPSPE